MATIFKIRITKAKADLEVDFDELPKEVKLAIVEKGLAAFLNGATAKETTKTTPDEAVRAENAMALANKKLDALKRGELKAARAKSDGKVSGVVMTEARRLAKNIVKAGIKAAGHKISDYEAKAITEAANAYIEEHPEIVQQAQASVEAAKALAAATSVPVASIPISHERVAKREAKNAEARKATASKDAGKPGAQKSTTKRRPAPIHA
jgi:hypothetical protein